MFILVALIIGLLFKYSPKIEIVYSGNKKIVLLWYTKYNMWEDIAERRYIELFRF